MAHAATVLAVLALGLLAAGSATAAVGGQVSRGIQFSLVMGIENSLPSPLPV